MDASSQRIKDTVEWGSFRKRNPVRTVLVTSCYDDDTSIYLDLLSPETLERYMAYKDKEELK